MFQLFKKDTGIICDICSSKTPKYFNDSPSSEGGSTNLCIWEAGDKVRLEPGLIFEGISHQLLVPASSSQLAACRDAAEPGTWCSAIS